MAGCARLVRESLHVAALGFVVCSLRLCFLLGILFGCGRLRLLGCALDNIETPANKSVDARPWSAQVSEHNFALAFLIGADRDIVRAARPLHGLALGHAKRDAAR